MRWSLVIKMLRRLIDIVGGYTDGWTHAITWQWVWSLDAQSQVPQLSSSRVKKRFSGTRAQLTVYFELVLFFLS